VNSSDTERLAVHAPHVAPVVLLLLQTRDQSLSGLCNTDSECNDMSTYALMWQWVITL